MPDQAASQQWIAVHPLRARSASAEEALVQSIRIHLVDLWMRVESLMLVEDEVGRIECADRSDLLEEFAVHIAGLRLLAKVSVRVCLRAMPTTLEAHRNSVLARALADLDEGVGSVLESIEVETDRRAQAVGPQLPKNEVIDLGKNVVWLVEQDADCTFFSRPTTAIGVVFAAHRTARLELHDG